MSPQETGRKRRSAPPSSPTAPALPTRIPFVDLAADFARVRAGVAERFERVLASQIFVLGEQTRAFESAMADLTGARHAVACSSGSDALTLALTSLGVGPGDAVLVPSFTFFASAGAIVRVGAVPVFVDVDERSYLAGPTSFREALHREFRRRQDRWLSRRGDHELRAVIAVHLFGRATDVSAIRSAVGASVPVVEDAAQAIGARHDGRAVGSLGEIGCFSFYPTKNLGAAGDAGLVTTSDDELARALRMLRVHGADADRYLHERCGFNARMDELQAAYLNAKLPLLAEFTAARRRLAALYRERLGGLADRGLIVLPPECDESADVWHQFVVRVGRQRDAVLRRLTEQGVDARIFYPLPLHLQPAFAGCGYRRGDLPRSESVASEVLSLPLYPSLSDDALDVVCAALGRSLDT